MICRQCGEQSGECESAPAEASRRGRSGLAGACTRVARRYFRAALVMWKLRVKCKVTVMTDLADDAPIEVRYGMGISRRTIGNIRYAPDAELCREPQMGRFTIAELRTFVPYVTPDGADLSLWERCCSGGAAPERDTRSTDN